MEITSNLECDRTIAQEFKRRIKTQTVLPSADTAAMLFWALLTFPSDHHAEGGWLAKPSRKAVRPHH
jgi:hypothetical protein